MNADDTLLTGIDIDADIAERALATVESDVLRPIAEAFARNVSRVRKTLSMPRLTTQAALGILGMGVIIWKNFREECERSKTGSGEKLPVSEEAVLARSATATLARLAKPEAIEQLRGEFEPILRSEVTDQILAVVTKHEGIREWIEGQLATAASSAWTLVECLATDLWVMALNEMPTKFYKGVVTSHGQGDMPEGLSGKQVSIGLLAKYHFDLTGRMGTILKPKFDFTNLTNIRKAYEAAFENCGELETVFSDKKVHLLEASRHVIVHRAGVVDDEFAARTKHTGVNFEVGKQLPLTGELVSAMVNSSIRLGAAILAFVDAKLVREGKQSESAVAD